MSPDLRAFMATIGFFAAVFLVLLGPLAIVFLGLLIGGATDFARAVAGFALWVDLGALGWSTFLWYLMPKESSETG